ncbi:hypothetical protein H2200_013567 [Cladophialophora chaetospira]|uniref:Transcription factor TFIIIC complex subunit Tfc6 n=1 Tax=Cladophialophora chaetospira TaxID=386627 RepID=A0AA38UE82_9EURO|nr:hypothetical protein H2200_013567 [Cladophialophora chaetospira]
MAEPRRSGRQRKANPKYANDGWDKDILRKLHESSESSGPSPHEDESPSGPEDHDILDAIPDQLEADNDVSMASAASNQSSDVDTADEDDGDIIFASDENGASRSIRPRPFLSNTSGTARSHAIQYPRDLGNAESYPGIFGPGVDDLYDVLQARDTWLKARDITLPSLQTLASSIKTSSQTTRTEDHPIDSTEPEKPPHTTIPSFSILRTQVLTPLSRAELDGKYLVRQNPPHAVVLGPSGKQQKYEIDHLSALDFGQAWQMEIQDATDENSTIGEAQIEERYHEGCLLNLGENVQCLAWAPCLGSVQYLAIAVRCTSGLRQMVPPTTNDRPAFHPSPHYPSSIQVWAFQTKHIAFDGHRALNMQQEPKLLIVLATEWGNIRHLKWCPSSRLGANEDVPRSDDSTIGFLGVVSSDGHARVVAVPRASKADNSEMVAYRVERAAFDVAPPHDTLFTTLTFASPTDLLLGTANGFIYVYDVSERMSEGNTPKSYMHHQVHHTYIISLCSASAPHSTLVPSTSASGELVLTDLKSPEQDRVVVSRSCFPNPDLIYMPFTRSFFAVLDRSGNSQVERNAATLLACHHVRQFPSLLKVAKLPRWTGAATALAGSRWHPCILVGNAKGQVLATNYLRKILPYPRTENKKAGGAYLQKICEYDWQPLTKEDVGKGVSTQADETAEKEDLDIYHGRDARPGMSRFHEGFQPEKIDVGNFLPAGRKVKKGKTEELNGEAIFEEEQAVTVIDWNPNAECAGLVAIGWGSGIVKVQDLAYDAQEG